MYRILIIEDDPAARRAVHRELESRGHDVVAVDASTAITSIVERDFDIVVAGLAPADAPTGAGTFPIAPELLCLPRPLAMDAVVDAVGEIADRDAVRDTLEHARRSVHQDRVPGSRIIGTSPAMRSLLGRVAALAASDAAVLLTGESGTGKELMAHMLHDRSPRGDRPLVIVNCAAFPEALIEAELFGHERGAFTGALHKRDGRFKAADGGTLFLDEIDGLSQAAQAKLLRVLQDGTFTPIGTNTPITVDVRLISATNRDLKALVAQGVFREDLYYRVKVLDLDLPPLRERTGDLPLLVAQFLLEHAPTARRPTLSPRAWAALSTYAFPGNVRELEHAIQRAVVLAGGFEIDLEHLPPEITAIAGVPTTGDGVELQPLSVAVREFERAYLLRALDVAGGNKTRAARLLGVSRKHLWEKLRRLGSEWGGD